MLDPKAARYRNQMVYCKKPLYAHDDGLHELICNVVERDCRDCDVSQTGWCFFFSGDHHGPAGDGDDALGAGAGGGTQRAAAKSHLRPQDDAIQSQERPRKRTGRLKYHMLLTWVDIDICIVLFCL